MAAATPKKTSNFKTYEAQARLLTALIASHDFRIDYKSTFFIFLSYHYEILRKK